MQPERTDLDPPKNDPFTQEQLKAYDGTDASKPVYVAIKGKLCSAAARTTPQTIFPFSPVTPLSLSRSHARARLYLTYTCIFITGTVFDVTRKRETYGPGGSYAVLAGKDGSRALGLSSLKPEDAVADWSTLEDKDRKVLDDWYTFFTCVVLVFWGVFFSFWLLIDFCSRSTTGNGIISSVVLLTCPLPLRTSDG